MKTKFLFGALAAFGMMTACSSDETADAEKPKGEGIESYVSFSVVSNDASGSRADGLSSADKDAEFEEAQGNEATIDNVVLLFYDKDGNAINVNMGSTNTNYKVILSPELSGSKEPVGSDYNVEHWFQKTIAITTASTLTEARVLAVVNANIDENGMMCNKNNTPISGSIAKTTFYDASFPGSYNDDLFVMSTSVYAASAETTTTVISDVAINIFDTETAAAADPAIIYVERVKARAKVIAGTNVDAKSLYTVNLKDVELPAEEKDKTFKIKVLGWDLNTTANNAYMFKHLDKSYGFKFTWNDPALHRSYWEAPFHLTSTADYSASFTPGNITSAPGSGFKYCNPNTTNLATKVLVYTQLVQEDGTTPADIATWYTNNYTLEDLKTAILDASPKVVYVPGEEGKYVNIDKQYVDFRQGKGTTTDMDKSWMAYPILKTKLDASDANDIVYYKKVEKPTVDGVVISFSEITVAEAMQMIGFQNADGTNKLQGAKIWNEGRAYYFVDVAHLGEQKAMVRNHSYTIRIDGFEGLGTPIFNPDEIIPEPTYPEDDKKSYVSVTMNVLSWRIVPEQGVIFGPKK